MNRPYRKKVRGARQQQTRQRIVEATIALHQERGIAATTIGDIAARAGVGRVTVYRHFPDEVALSAACSGQYFERNPLPDPGPWRAEADPQARLRLGLAETYAFFRRTAPMLAKVYPEARDHPAMAPIHAHWQAMVEVLAEPWPESLAESGAEFGAEFGAEPGVEAGAAGGRKGALLDAALALALDFETWHLLALRRGLDDAEAVDLMARLTCDCGGARIRVS